MSRKVQFLRRILFAGKSFKGEGAWKTQVNVYLQLNVLFKHKNVYLKNKNVYLLYPHDFNFMIPLFPI